jgi:galactose oxidase-like protein/PKD domain-containing protein
MSHPLQQPRLRRTLRLTVAFAATTALLNGPLARGPLAQGAGQGAWTTLPYTMPINPVHLALMNDGKVLVVAGSGNVAAETNFRAAVWDPVQGTIAVQQLSWDMFCNGMVTLPDGRVFVNGGNAQYDPFHGELRNAVFDPALGVFSNVENMAHGRWYPTTTVLGDGRVMTFSGLNETGGTNTAVEIYTPGSGWSAESPAGWTPPLYPRMHLLPNGSVFYSGSGRASRLFNPATRAWSSTIATTNYSGTRTYGTSILLPLSPSDNYRARVMIFGGGNPSTATTEIIEPLAPAPAWTYGPSMSQPRIEMNATILPNGKILALGGSLNDEDVATASLKADLYDPATNTFSSAGSNAYPRLYHSGSLLLPDATVAVLGGNPQRGNYESRIEIYSPAYLFDAAGQPAVRPVITGLSSAEVAMGSTFQVFTNDAASIASVVLIRPGAPTHAFDMEQRMVKTNFTAGANALDVVAPPNGNVAPPGYYMLFVLNGAGVPSFASWVHLSAAAANQPPTAAILAPLNDVTIAAGQSVAFSGSGTDPDGTIASYAWSFPGGSPSSSTSADAGSVTYAAPGTYVASLKVTDNGGLASAAATRTITVPDFSLSATPSSRSIAAGATTTYTATVTAGTGFAGAVSLSVGGLPQGAAAAFAPESITGSGSSTLTITTTTAIAAGSYPLTITGTSGTVVHSAIVTLVVSGDFSLSATPSSRTVSRGGSTTFTVTVAAGAGFSGTTTLSVSGLPKQTTGKFAPSSIVNSGSSTLTVSAKRQVARGTYTLTISGASGSLVRTATVSLVVQ